jgi:hypothetical protein
VSSEEVPQPPPARPASDTEAEDDTSELGVSDAEVPELYSGLPAAAPTRETH